MSSRPTHPRSFQANAGDPRQSKKAGELERLAKERRLAGWRHLLSSSVGRELAWSLLAECHVFSPIMATSPFIFENAGRHDWGLVIMGEITEADEDAFVLMQREAMARARNLPETPKHISEEELTDE